MDCKDCHFESRCFPLLKLLNRIKNTVCQQGRYRNRQTTINEALDALTQVKPE